MIAHQETRYDALTVPESHLGKPSRHAALAAAVARIRVRSRGRVAVEQILLAAAAVLFPLGLVFILLGWEGAAHNGHTYAQIDYLISGGIFGLGLSVAGGFMYFGYWLSRQLGESRRQNDLTVQALQRLEDLLDFAVNTRAPAGATPTPAGATPTPAGRNPRQRRAPAGAPAPGAAAVPAAAEAYRARGQVQAVSGQSLFATPRGTLLHRPGCPVVTRRGDLKAVAPGTEGYGYCTMCNPAASPPEPARRDPRRADDE